jgi:hypothetical protein
MGGAMTTLHAVQIRDANGVFGRTWFEDEPALEINGVEIRSTTHVQLSFSAGLRLFGFTPHAKGFVKSASSVRDTSSKLSEGKEKKKKWKTHIPPNAL